MTVIASTSATGTDRFFYAMRTRTLKRALDGLALGEGNPSASAVVERLCDLSRLMGGGVEYSEAFMLPHSLPLGSGEHCIVLTVSQPIGGGSKGVHICTTVGTAH